MLVYNLLVVYLQSVDFNYFTILKAMYIKTANIDITFIFDKPLTDFVLWTFPGNRRSCYLEVEMVLNRKV